MKHVLDISTKSNRQINSDIYVWNFEDTLQPQSQIKQVMKSNFHRSSAAYISYELLSSILTCTCTLEHGLEL